MNVPELNESLQAIKVPIPGNPLGYLISYLFKGEGGPLLVDSGWNAGQAFDALEAELNARGVKPSELKRLVITHMHPDHFGLAGKLKRLSGCEILMHEVEAKLVHKRYVDFTGLLEEIADWLAKNGTPQGELNDLKGASLPALQFVCTADPDQALVDGDIIRVGDYNLKVIHTPGHSPGHICLYDCNKGILLSGDHVLPGITPNVSLNPQTKGNPLKDYLESLGRLKELKPSIVLPAHEAPFKGLEQRIQEILDHHEKRLLEIQRIINGRPQSAYDVARRVKWSAGLWEEIDVWNRRAAIMEVAAHLEYMAEHGKLNRVDWNGIAKYQLA